MRADMTKSTVVTTRLDPAMTEALDALAERLDRSRAWIVAKAVAGYVHEKTEFLDFIKEGEDALDRGEFYTQEEMEEWVQSLGRADAA
jgi:predicted transcriptional regulator